MSIDAETTGGRLFYKEVWCPVTGEVSPDFPVFYLARANTKEQTA